MQIREATSENAQTVKTDLLVPGYRETTAVDPEFSELDEDGVADVGVERWLDDDDRVLFVAEREREGDAELVGHISAGRYDSPPIYARGPYANVDGLYVKPAHRREGVAAALLLPITYSVIVENYRGSDRATAFGAVGGVTFYIDDIHWQ